MNKILSDTIQIIRNKRNEFINEASITSLINGILYSYGWNVFDPCEVAPQYNILNEAKPEYPNRADLALKLFGKRKILIEIKDIKKGKNLKRHERQLKGYLKKTPDVHLGILTNAASWWFYISYKDENNQINIDEGPKVNIIKDDDSKIEIIFSKYLSKEKMVEEWYQTNLNNLTNSSRKLNAIVNLRAMKDKRVIQPLLQIFNEDKEHYARSSALFGILELDGLNDDIIKPLLKQALNDRNSSIREKAEAYLDGGKKQNEKKIQ